MKKTRTNKKLKGGSFFPLSVMKPYYKSAKRYMGLGYNTNSSSNSSNNFANQSLNSLQGPANEQAEANNAGLGEEAVGNNVYRENMNNEFFIYLVQEYERNLGRNANSKEKKYLFDEYIRKLLI